MPALVALPLLASLLAPTDARAEAPKDRVDVVDGGKMKMEDKRSYQNLVVLGPAFLPLGLNARYQRLLADNISVIAGAGFGASTWTVDGDELRLTRVKGMVGMDYHPIGNGLHGFYLGPRVEYRQWSAVAVSEGADTAGYDIRTFNGEAIAGWRWVWNPGPSLGLGLGAGYAERIGSGANNDDLDFARTGFGFRGEFTLGWAF